MSEIEKFMQRVEVTASCWLWTGASSQKGYGLLGPQYPERRAHRYSYAYFTGSIPEGYMVLHTCDNPRCVKPTHLKLGTAQDNTNDMVRKGRSKFNMNLGKQHGFKLGNPGYGYRRAKYA